MDFSLPAHELQLQIEKDYSRKHINSKIIKIVNDSEDVQGRIDLGVTLVENLIQGTYYESKEKRLRQLKSLNIRELVSDIIVATCHFQVPELFVSAVSQLTHHLGFDDKEDAIKTMSELLAVLCETNLFDIIKPSKYESLVLQSCIQLPEDFMKYVDNVGFLPPMVVEPKKLKTNYDSAYLTHKESVLLGPGNHHNGNTCLDTLNIINSVPLKLATDFISLVPEEPQKERITQEQEHDWNVFRDRSLEMYGLIVSCGNKFWFNHRYDKRGRVYSTGYHIHTQGSPYKKASIELYDEELVEGVPE